MKLLGRGWQYSVYDLGNGRVLKKRNPRIIAYWMMFRSTVPLSPLWNFPLYYRHIGNNAADSIRKIHEMNIDPDLVGNPKFFDTNLDYEQDYIESAGDYLSHVSLVEAKKLVDAFVGFVDHLIEIRFMDKSFNLGANFGVRTDGILVLTDIGEAYSNPENIRKQIDKRAWSASYVLKALPSREIRDYFVSSLDKHFNEK